MTHLSRMRKRNLEEIPIVAASETGRAQTTGEILMGLKDQTFNLHNLAEGHWKVPSKKVKALYAKS